MLNRSSELDRILVRLTDLERRHRRMKTLGGLSVVIAAAAMLMGQAPAGGRAVEVDKLTVVDSRGRPRILLGTMEDEPFIVLYDTNDRARVALSISGGESNLEYYDSAGKRRAALAGTGQGAGLEFYDSAEKRRVGLIAAGDAPSLVFSDAASTTRMVMGVGSDGPDLEMYSGNGKRRVALGALEELGPRFALFDSDGLVRTAMGVTLQGPTLILSDDRVRPRLQLDVSGSGPSIQFKHTGGRMGVALSLDEGKPGLTMTDPDGKSVFHAP